MIKNEPLLSEREKALETNTAICKFCLKAGAVNASWEAGGWYHVKCYEKKSNYKVCW